MFELFQERSLARARARRWKIASFLGGAGEIRYAGKLENLSAGQIWKFSEVSTRVFDDLRMGGLVIGKIPV